MSFHSSPFALSKRTRDDEEDSPSGKRCRTFKLVEPVEQPQIAPPTSNFSTTLAQQRQQALERMEFGAAEREDIEMDMDGGNASDSSSVSNPRHPWNVVGAPAMAHQTSSNSLSNSSAASSMPGTPLDGQFNYSTSSTNYPSRTNPTSFTDMSGNTIHFHDSGNTIHDNSAPSVQHEPISNGFVAQAWANAQAKQQQQQYGWDYPRQSNNFALGGHLV